MVDLTCREHPKYKAKRKPTGRCKLCKRIWRFKLQRDERGWDDSDTWSLDHTIAKFVVPRLRRFQELEIGFKEIIEDDTDAMDYHASQSAWYGIVEMMCEAFDFLASDERWETHPDDPRWATVEEGLSLFAEYFCCLWW